MKTIKDYPPNYERLNKVFSLQPNVIFTYGDTIYNPGGGEIPNHLEQHEAIHFKQQGDNIDEWWDKYIKDKDFRLSQEVEAYRRQYRVAKNTMGRGELFNLLKTISKDLSGDVYGNIIEFQEAMNLINN